MNLTLEEYTAIYNKAYRHDGKGSKDARFMRLIRESNAITRPKIEPHKCRTEIREIERHGEKITVEWRH